MSTLNIYAIVAPAVFGLVLFEFFYCLYKKNGYYSFQDSLMGMGTMIIAQLANVLISILIVMSYGWVFHNYAIFKLENTWLNLAICYVGVDFFFYWFHRAGHRINFLWAAHATHHSAEELNYAVAMRTSFTQRAASFLFYWPLALIGFTPETVITVVAVNLVYQFVPHTRVIGRFPRWIDSWLNTPYHHQVHHGANKVYWDKNYGGTFIIWDKLFGTYQDQVEEVYYGITIHPKSWDPTYLNIHWFTVLWSDMMKADHFIDKIKIWFMPPGWRPRNLGPYENKSPHNTAREQIKYVSNALPNSSLYLGLHLALSMGVLILVIRHDSPLTVFERISTGLMLYLNITLWAAILESKPWAKVGEMLRIVLFTVLLGSICITHQFGHFWINGLIASSLASIAWVAFGMKRSEAVLA
jgi:sterol desaturase/sphingolipid hydroxylase (fatty acid hydroxylase superfamily)